MACSRPCASNSVMPISRNMSLTSALDLTCSRLSRISVSTVCDAATAAKARYLGCDMLPGPVNGAFGFN